MQRRTDEPRSEDERFARLLRAVADGDRAAFEALYRAASPRIFGICLRFLPDRAEAEDVLQEVFAKVWAKAGTFDPSRTNGMAWLAMVARNKAIDRLRALPPAQRHVAVDMAEHAQDPGVTPARGAESAEQRAQLDRCLEQLDARRRGLIRSAFFDGATYEELAVRIGSPLGTVKSWIRRGLAQLRLCLEA